MSFGFTAHVTIITPSTVCLLCITVCCRSNKSVYMCKILEISTFTETSTKLHSYHNYLFREQVFQWVCTYSKNYEESAFYTSSWGAAEKLSWLLQTNTKSYSRSFTWTQLFCLILNLSVIFLSYHLLNTLNQIYLRLVHFMLSILALYKY